MEWNNIDPSDFNAATAHLASIIDVPTSDPVSEDDWGDPEETAFSEHEQLDPEGGV